MTHVHFLDIPSNLVSFPLRLSDHRYTPSARQQRQSLPRRVCSGPPFTPSTFSTIMHRQRSRRALRRPSLPLMSLTRLLPYPGAVITSSPSYTHLTLPSLWSRCTMRCWLLPRRQVVRELTLHHPPLQKLAYYPLLLNRLSRRKPWHLQRRQQRQHTSNDNAGTTAEGHAPSTRPQRAASHFLCSPPPLQLSRRNREVTISTSLKPRKPVVTTRGAAVREAAV